MVAVYKSASILLFLQQSSHIRDHLDLRVGAICGEMGVDWWDAGRWKRVLDEHDVLVSTPQVCCCTLFCNEACRATHGMSASTCVPYMDKC